MRKGEKITGFSGANASIGTLFLRFDSRSSLDKALANQKKWLFLNVI